MGRYQCHKCQGEFARSDGLKRHLSSGVCKKDQKDRSESDEEIVVSVKRSYGLGEYIFGKDPNKLVEMALLIIPLTNMKKMKLKKTMKKTKMKMKKTKKKKKSLKRRKSIKFDLGMS